MAILVGVTILVAMFGCIVALFAEVAKLRSRMSYLEQLPHGEEGTSDHLQQINTNISSIESRLDKEIAAGSVQQLNISLEQLMHQWSISRLINESVSSIEDRLREYEAIENTQNTSS